MTEVNKDITVKKLYKFELNEYYANLYGLFITTEEEINNAIGKTINFGDVAGKYSEVYTHLDRDHIHELKVNKTTIDDLLEANGTDNGCTIVGYNPLDYLDRDAEWNEYESASTDIEAV